MLICAEVGINHDGDMDLCHELVRQASINGADCVKFQLYDPKEIFKDEPHLIEEGLRCTITESDFDRIMGWCEEESIEPFFSVFDETRLSWTESAGVNKYKLASRSLKKTPDFCRKVIDTGKEVFASTGMVSISSAKDLLGSDTRYIYCVSKYPAEFSDYKNQPKDYLNSDWFGISDHTFGIENSLFAVSHGARFVEKHFTLSKTMSGSDHKCSITPSELYDLKKYSKLISKLVLS